MNINEMLEKRHETTIQWNEPWPACGPEGNDLPAHVTCRASVHDCINMARLLARDKGRPTYSSDAEFLDEFCTIHFASVAS